MDLVKRNNVKVVGDGPVTMVYAHGFGCDQSMWRYLVPVFESGCRNILFDLTGSGSSDLAAYDFKKYNSLDGYASDLLEIIDGFSDGPVIFIGHSVSATIGLLATIKAPEKFRAQVMVGPSPCYINDGDYIGGFSREDIDDLIQTMESNYLGWSSTMAPAIMGAHDREELGQELTNSFCRTDPTIAKHFAKVTFLSDHRAMLSKSTTPALILQCSEDIIAPRSVGEYMQNQMPNSELVIIENVGHCPHLSAPEPSIAAMQKFLNQLVF
ncbi:alpha/beta hydrolase [Ketobacter sp. MCCC 1A13808]|uniref:alpha/beta fold hydrolase n=1 Tax=Ketobacter sp. MCCC 1A13808 TaxID=2602738 RepID=UPI000F126090|nr:alpha/beta hydrolase [Ketobacter sp. MCCC 1A13808]MVF13193.1 alpha/beta hydrolase [Ketobacter sp. MCCC 1A13808]RLP52528.1 MAG: alpha/beta hydrolase [Ketobacter sp.]